MALILIVDDDLHTRQLWVALLTPFGHQVMEADAGQRGLEEARRRNPDLIISDVLMPSMNGYEFVSSLRKIPELQTTPVIFHSASFLDHETRCLGATCGVSLVIPKPCDPEKALAIVCQALGTEVGNLSPPQKSGDEGKAIPILIDAFFEKGKELDVVTLRLAALLDLGLQLARPSEARALLRKAGKAAREIVGVSYAAVGIFKKGTVQLESLTLLGMDSATVEKIGTPRFDGEIFRSMVAEPKPKR